MYLKDEIHSVAFTQDNQSAYISDLTGNIRMIKWKLNASSGHDFDLTQKSKVVGASITREICLTKDDTNLLVGSDELVSVFNTETREVTKEFKFTDVVCGIKLINYGKSVFIAEQNGDLSIIDLETMEIILSHKKITNVGEILKIVVI